MGLCFKVCAAPSCTYGSCKLAHLQVECPPEGACHLLGARVEREVADCHTECACRRGGRVHVLGVRVVRLRGLVAAAAGAACEGAAGRRQVGSDTHVVRRGVEGKHNAEASTGRGRERAAYSAVCAWCCTHPHLRAVARTHAGLCCHRAAGTSGRCRPAACWAAVVVVAQAAWREAQAPPQNFHLQAGLHTTGSAQGPTLVSCWGCTHHRAACGAEARTLLTVCFIHFICPGLGRLGSACSRKRGQSATGSGSAFVSFCGEEQMRMIWALHLHSWHTSFALVGWCGVRL